MTEFDAGEFPYKFEVIELDKMFVDESYQRPLTKLVNKIFERFNPALIGTVVLSYREDSKLYALMDGQTRHAGVKKRLEAGQPAPAKLPAVVFFGLTQAEEAKLFSLFQTERQGVASAQRFRAALVGQDPEALAINHIATQIGYKIGPVSKTTISAVAALEKLYRDSPEILERSLEIFMEAWKDKHMPDGGAIRGMGYFLKRTADVDDERLAQRLSLVKPKDLKHRAAMLREGQGGIGGSSDRFVAGAIEGIYRAGR